MKSCSLEQLIISNKVLICVGSGGVGKTTVSATVAVRAAQLGKRVLVMTIDPARRLRVALGLSGSQTGPMLVPEQKFSGQLYASLLDAEKIFLDFIVSAAIDPQKAQNLVKNRLYQQLSTTLSGSQEFTSLLQLSRLVQANEFDLIVLDTPPSQHAIDFLEAPEKIGALFKDSITRWFLSESEKERNIIKKIISRGTKTALSALEFITGSLFMSELNEFFQSVGTVQGKIADITTAAQGILQSPQTSFLLITGFNEVKLDEAMYLKKYLDSRKYNLAGVILNRSLPAFSVKNFSGGAHLMADLKPFGEYFEKKELQVQRFIAQCEAHLLIVRTKDFNEDIIKLSALERFAHELAYAFNHSVSGRMHTGQ